MSTLLAELQKPTIKEKTRHSRVLRSKELLVFCPQCKALETLWFLGDALMQARRFSQQNGYVYHDCGSTVPCRLYCSL